MADTTRNSSYCPADPSIIAGGRYLLCTNIVAGWMQPPSPSWLCIFEPNVPSRQLQDQGHSLLRSQSWFRARVKRVLRGLHAVRQNICCVAGNADFRVGHVCFFHTNYYCAPQGMMALDFFFDCREVGLVVRTFGED